MEQLTKVRDNSSNRENRVGGSQRGETGVERERREEECVRGEGDFRIATVHPLLKLVIVAAVL